MVVSLLSAAAFAVAISGGLAYPFNDLAARDAPLQWTAWGDSYASGVHAGDWARQNSWQGFCYRFDQAYTWQLNASSDANVPGSVGKRNFKNLACAGHTSDDVMKWQFQEKDTWSYYWGDLPSPGNPSFATLSVGGDDIGFPNIIKSCILELQGVCRDQLETSKKLLNDDKLVNDIVGVIDRISVLGKKGPAGDKFRLIVAGYPRFFNSETDQCDHTSFNWRGLQGPGHQNMTKDLRREFNQMADKLNSQIAKAVSIGSHNNQNVDFVDYNANGQLDGHRYCEPGAEEPDENRVKRGDTWFYHYPYGIDTSQTPVENYIASFYDPNIKTVDALNKKYGANLPDAPKFRNGNIWQALVNNTNGDLQMNSWLSERVKMFHPTVPGHALITKNILNQLAIDAKKASPTSSPAPSKPTPAPSKPTAKDICGDWYQVYNDHFEIYGKDWDNDKLRQWGGGLLDNLRGCGTVTHWTFDYLTNDPQGMQWKATGNMPIGTKSCVGSALAKAGGGGPDGCTGSG